MGQSFIGNKIVLTSKFDPKKVWERDRGRESERLDDYGDAMARPFDRSP